MPSARYAEVVVNVPIRRSYNSRHQIPTNDSDGEPRPESLPGLRSFHYEIPAALEGELRPGHLVWAPFGSRRVQGVVMRLTASTPVPAKPLDRLARSEPVLTAQQIELAEWIAHEYVAPLSEAIKLFLPPGLLQKQEEARGVRVKRELQVELVDEAFGQNGAFDAVAPLLALGRETQQVQILHWLLKNAAGESQDGRGESAPNKVPGQAKETSPPNPLPSEGRGLHPIRSQRTSAEGESSNAPIQGQPPTTRATLRQALHLKSNSAIDTLLEKNLLREEDDALQLAHSPAETQQALLDLRGATRYMSIVETLHAAGQPLWKSDLYAALAERDASTTLAHLRDLQQHGLVTLTERVRFRDPLAGRTYPRRPPPVLTSEQARVWSEIEAALGTESSEAPKFLLHGVTGSGKTEIYLRAIERTLAQGKQAAVLVPEIALTPQTVARFAGRFPGRVTVIHSQLSQGERYDVWRAVRDGEFDVVVGPRSALFAPLARLGLVILDEEHESSYKQNAEEWGSFTVFYDARRVAERLAELTGSTLILGSATPSLERYHAAVGSDLKGDFTLLEMPHRVRASFEEVPSESSPAASESGDEVSVLMSKTPPPNPLPSEARGLHPSRGQQDDVGGERSVYADMPPVEIVDMRQELRAGNRSIFSRSLQSELHATLDAGEQAILFLNRRGTHTFVMCRDCGTVVECPRCEIPLTYHDSNYGGRATELICHRCNHREAIPSVCAECQSRRIKYFGSGTQRIEEYVSEIAPRATLLRWDADTTGHKGSHEAILSRFAAGEANVLVGTQMIAKGLDLPMVTLVGVVAADVGLHLPDFRSGERTFQLLTQVAGRAGRSQRGGRVVIQTYTPEHYAIQAAAQHDYHAFYEREIAFREEHGYPPLRRLARLVYWEKKLEKAQAASESLAAVLRQRLESMALAGEYAGVLGPAPAPFARYRGYYRWQILLRAPDPALVLRGVDLPFGWRVDVDPLSTL